MKKLSKLLSLFMAVLIGAIMPMLSINACAEAAPVQNSSVRDCKFVSKTQAAQKSPEKQSNVKQFFSKIKKATIYMGSVAGVVVGFPLVTIVAGVHGVVALVNLCVCSII